MKNIFKSIWKNKGCSFLAFLTFFVGVFLFFISLGDAFIVRLQIILLGILPWLILLFLSIKKVKLCVPIVIVICLFSFPFYYLFFLFYSAALESFHPITNPRYYQYKVKDDWLLQVFPKEIPKNAENLYFEYQPGFLQAGSSVSLYFINSQLDVEEFHNYYKDKAIWIGYRYQKNYENIDLRNSLSNFPAENKSEFLIYLIEGSCDNSGYCNHGNFLFTAINEKTKEIIYKGEDW